MSTMEPIVFLTTGGTFDAERAGSPSIGPPAAPELLSTARVTAPVRCIELMRKDSSLLTDADRELICRAVREAAARRIVIVHGTDTLKEALDVLASVAGKVIVVTGSFEPARVAASDASFNLG